MLEAPELTILEAATGPEVLSLTRAGGIDLVVCDLQMGSMGAMAVTMELRHDESYGLADPVPVLMLLDRRADAFLARRCGAEGFVLKPLEPLTVRSAVRDLLRGDAFEDEALTPATVRAGDGA
jgi:DNA-binding NarL/FixJ family response regulator